jgi:hypothetical protein
MAAKIGGGTLYKARDITILGILSGSVKVNWQVQAPLAVAVTVANLVHTMVPADISITLNGTAVTATAFTPPTATKTADTDCVGAWSACVTTCQQLYVVTAVQSGSGSACAAPHAAIRICAGGNCVAKTGSPTSPTPTPPTPSPTLRDAPESTSDSSKDVATATSSWWIVGGIAGGLVLVGVVVGLVMLFVKAECWLGEIALERQKVQEGSHSHVLPNSASEALGQTAGQRQRMSSSSATYTYDSLMVTRATMALSSSQQSPANQSIDNEKTGRLKNLPSLQHISTKRATSEHLNVSTLTQPPAIPYRKPIAIPPRQSASFAGLAFDYRSVQRAPPPPSCFAEDVRAADSMLRDPPPLDQIRTSPQLQTRTYSHNSKSASNPRIQRTLQLGKILCTPPKLRPLTPSRSTRSRTPPRGPPATSSEEDPKPMQCPSRSPTRLIQLNPTIKAAQTKVAQLQAQRDQILTGHSK